MIHSTTSKLHVATNRLLFICSYSNAFNLKTNKKQITATVKPAPALCSQWRTYIVPKIPLINVRLQCFILEISVHVKFWHFLASSVLSITCIIILCPHSSAAQHDCVLGSMWSTCMLVGACTFQTMFHQYSGTSTLGHVINSLVSCLSGIQPAVPYVYWWVVTLQPYLNQE